MKVLPCEHCKGARALKHLNYAPATLKDGAVYTMLSWPPTCQATMGYKCARCKRRTEITANGFNLLPTLSFAQLRDMGLHGPVVQDLSGAGIMPSQLAELEAAGLTVGELLANP